MNYTIINDDCLIALKQMKDNTVDALVCDPPAGISFMGKKWDSNKGGRDQWIKWLSEVMRECLRVLKPGAHGLVWALPRTSHWTATALEDAGFEIRDVVNHIFGSGFPKSHNISKAIEGKQKYGKSNSVALKKVEQDGNGKSYKLVGKNNGILGETKEFNRKEYMPESDDAIKYKGYGTALKPATEHWILVRKPLEEKTIAKNVLEYGTGGINIDGCRIGSEVLPEQKAGVKEKPFIPNYKNNVYGKGLGGGKVSVPITSRFPSNVILDEYAGSIIDEQSGDTGGASRFFYVAKASASEKDAGLEGRNTHPTVKSIKLMSYLIRLISPPGDTLILDPFMGSGSTGCACVAEGKSFIGIEMDEEYCEIAKARINNKEE